MKTYSEQMLDAIEENDYAEAELLLEKAIRFDQEDVLESLGDELFRMGFLDEAKKIFTKLHEKNSGNASINISLAEIAIEEDNIDEALDYLSRVKKGAPEYPTSLLVAADLYLTIDLPETSEAKLKEALTLLPDEPTIKFALAELYLEIDHYQDALMCYQQLLADGIEEFAQVRIPKQVAVAYSRIGKFDEAIELLEKELLLDRQDDVLYLLAILYIQQGESERAIPLLQEIRLMGDTYLDVYVPLVSALIDGEQLEEAEEMIKEGISKNSYNISLYHLASDFAFKYHRVSEAEEYLLQALKVEEDRELTLIKLSNLYLTEERYEEVIDLLEETKELMHVQGHWSLAKAYYGMEEYEAAREQYEKAYEGLEDEPEFLREYGLFLREEGYMEKANALLNDYLLVVPDDLEIDDLLRME